MPPIDEELLERLARLEALFAAYVAHESGDPRRASELLRSTMRSPRFTSAKIDKALDELVTTFYRIPDPPIGARSQVKPLQRDLHEFLAALMLGLDTNEINLHRFISLRVYFPSERTTRRLSRNSLLVGEVLNRILASFDDIGFELADEYFPEFGSWFGKVILKTSERQTQADIQQQLQEIEHGIKLATLKKIQAEIDEKLAGAVGAILNALTDDGIIQIGSLLVVKYTPPEGSQITLARVLNTEEVMLIERTPSLLKDPEALLKALGKRGKIARRRPISSRK